jgi:hypothetical protein
MTVSFLMIFFRVLWIGDLKKMKKMPFEGDSIFSGRSS